MQNRAVSGQAEANWMRMRASLSTTRAPILSRFFTRVANSPQASGTRRGRESCRASISQYRAVFRTSLNWLASGLWQEVRSD